MALTETDDENQDEIGRALFVNWGKTPPPDSTETNKKIFRAWLVLMVLMFGLMLVYEMMKG